VAPEVQSDWARSSLRSIDSLLVHLAVRVELEADVLAADNADMRSLLADLGEAPVPVPDGASPAEGNELLRERVDVVLRRLLAAGDADGVAKVNAHVARQLERERPLVDPAFKGAIF